MELNSKDDYKVIETENKELSSDEEPVSPMGEELFEKNKALTTNAKLTYGYYNLWLVPCQTSLAFCFTISSPVKMRQDSLTNLIRLL